MLKIIDKRKYSYIFSGILIFLSLSAISFWGLKLGIDFKGGTLMEIQFIEPEKTDGTQTSFIIPSKNEIQEKLSDLRINSLTIQPSEDGRAILKYISSDENLNEKVLEKLEGFDGDIKELRVDFIGSSVSGQLKRGAALAAILAIIGIAAYIAWAFRKVSFPVPSWQYGIGAIIALAHDIIITIGIFSFLGHFFEVEVGTPFIAALLTILGYSVNDTIVVYDRIRENIVRSDSRKNFEDIANQSVNETIARSVNTSLTVMIVLMAIIIFGGETIKFFSIALLAGIAFGTYSSIFVASAFLVSSYNYKLNKDK